MCVSVCVCLSTSERVFLSFFMFVCVFFAVHMSLREGVCAFVVSVCRYFSVCVCHFMCFCMRINFMLFVRLGVPLQVF